MKKRGFEYKGFLYAGMIMTEDGPKVTEFNVRFGDPECQPAMMMIKSDLYEILTAALEGNGNPLQCSCLENPRDGGACWAAVYGVAQSWT